ncbi:MAG TPA: flagellar hook-length control protein FliK [Aliiroseovarius sp.]|nr:flagellar hook-length control protein FliK [Aliiroseovarius sp.]
MEKRRSLEPEAALADVRGTSTPTISTGSAPTVTPHHETARAVMVQLAHSMRANADRAIELRLHPEELGHVRMTFSTDHGGLSVTLTADRSETLDLLRRNIDMLGEELRRIGYGTVDFSFGGDTHQRGGEAEPWPSDEVSGVVPESAPDHDHIEETEARAMRGLAPTHGGVDMRI